MTPGEAKKIVNRFLKEHGLESRLSARTIGFSDLARVSIIFVRVHDWNPSPLWKDLQELARKNGFRVE